MENTLDETQLNKKSSEKILKDVSVKNSIANKN